MPARDLPWDVIKPFVVEYNEKRVAILKIVFLLLDESMSGYRPKTSKTGGYPNITFEPRKPVPLGTMLRNALECITGIFVNHDIVESPQGQWTKEFTSPPTQSHLPKGEDISYHTAEVLRQAKNVEKGGWVGGDAWFGSMETCVELKRRLGLYSTFIVKQNLNYFPMPVLHAVLRARYPQRTAGHWVVMKATISEVNVFVMAYAWLNRGVAYMVSSCGSTVRHEQNYRSKFEDEYGNVVVKELPRPTVAHLLYEFLPLIDEHNKARQNVLALERQWLTQDCWFRLLTTFVGMAVVDVQRWDRNMRAGRMLRVGEGDADFGIKRMANLIARPLRSGKFRYREGPQPSQRGGDGEYLVRIIDKQGNKTCTSGKPRNQRCFICRKYLNQYVNTTWWCIACGMPLCKKTRGRDLSCLEEHLSSADKHLGCRLMQRTCFFLPNHLKEVRRTRSSGPAKRKYVEANKTPSPDKSRVRSVFTPQ